MSFEIDMTQEPTNGLLAGINLWTITGASIENSKNSGHPMLVLKMKCGQVDLTDRAMLGGNGWGIGFKKLLGLGVPKTHKGALDPLDFIGRKLWVATALKEESYTSKSGEQKKSKKMEVDINQLAFAGYQPESDTPPGASAPVDVDDDCPFA